MKKVKTKPVVIASDDPLVGRDGITKVVRNEKGKVEMLVTGGVEITDPAELEKVLTTVSG